MSLLCSLQVYMGVQGHIIFCSLQLFVQKEIV